MSAIFHILNGDALLAQFPANIAGNKIIMRECLVDGPVIGKDLQDFISKRALFMQENYSTPIEEYIEKSVPELSKMILLKPQHEVNLWFEDDLFCQANFWFICGILKRNKIQKAYWIRPENNLQYGFGGLSTEELEKAHSVRTELGSIEIKILAQLWEDFRKKDLVALRKSIPWLPKTIKHIGPAITAEIARHDAGNQFGRPGVFIQKMLNDNPAVSFTDVFQSFRSELSIYGFGDLQVKHIYEALKSGMN